MRAHKKTTPGEIPGRSSLVDVGQRVFRFDLFNYLRPDAHLLKAAKKRPVMPLEAEASGTGAIAGSAV